MFTVNASLGYQKVNERWRIGGNAYMEDYVTPHARRESGGKGKVCMNREVKGERVGIRGLE